MKQPTILPRCHICDGGIHEHELRLHVHRQDDLDFPLAYIHSECFQIASFVGNNKVQERLAGDPEALKHAKAGYPPQFVKAGK